MSRLPALVRDFRFAGIGVKSGVLKLVVKPICDYLIRSCGQGRAELSTIYTLGMLPTVLAAFSSYK